MRVTSQQILNHKLGDAQLNVFQLAKEKTFIITIQDSESSILSVTDRQSNGELILNTTNGEPAVEGSCSIIDNVRLEELERLTEKVLKVINEKKDEDKRSS